MRSPTIQPPSVFFPSFSVLLYPPRSRRIKYLASPAQFSVFLASHPCQCCPLCLKSTTFSTWLTPSNPSVTQHRHHHLSEAFPQPFSPSSSFKCSLYVLTALKIFSIFVLYSIICRSPAPIWPTGKQTLFFQLRSHVFTLCL